VRQALVFGGFGAIGAAIADALAADGADVTRTSRGGRGLRVELEDMSGLDGLEGLDAVVWAQGTNVNDSVNAFDRARWDEVLHGNVTFVAQTMAELLARGKINDGARLVVVSSIWERQARQDKLSYTVSKAAVAGLVRSAAVDLAPRGILVNAVLPGVTDTPMTRGLLSTEQIDAFGAATGFGRLASLDDVANTVAHLCSQRNGGVTGESLAVDLGFTVARRV